MSDLGLGVLVRMLAGNAETVSAIQNSLNKTIKSIALADDVAVVTFAAGSVLTLRDYGQSCCESRYMRTDDNLDAHTGAKLLNIEMRDAPDEEGSYGDVHEVQFLLVTTDRGVITFANHNEHNGYYGGFSIEATYKEAS